MFKRLLVAAAVMCVTTPSFAADLVNYPDVSESSQYDWTGFHLGISGGYGFNADNPPYSFQNVPADVISLLPSAAHLDADGGLIGGTIGFDKQFGRLCSG